MKLLLSHLILFISCFAYSQTNSDTLSIYFGSNSASISTEDLLTIKSLKQKEHLGEINFKTFDGYTDTIGLNNYNVQLSKRRVKSVLDALSLTFNNTEWLARGENHLNKTLGYSKAKQRRVDIIYSTIATEPSIDEISAKIPEALEEQPIQEKSLTNDFVQFLQDTSINEITIQLSILFMPGTDAFLYPNDPQLGELFNFLHYNPKISAHIRGHVCCGDNLPLSHNRAMRVYNYLVRRSISPNRINYQGYSNKIPFTASEETEEDQQKNRRVDVIFSKHFAQ